MYICVGAYIKVNLGFVLFFFLLYFSYFQPFLLCSCLCFHLHDTTKKSSLSPPKQTLGLCWGIRETVVHVVHRLVVLFSFPLLFLIWQTSLVSCNFSMKWRMGHVCWALRATWLVALGSVGPLSILPLLHFSIILLLPQSQVIPAGYIPGSCERRRRQHSS